MNATQRYLDALARKLGGVSDYRIAQELGESRQRISTYRTGRNNFDNRVAVQVAQLLGLPPMEVIAQIELDRAKSDKDRDFWQKLGGKSASVALVGASILLGSAFPENAHAFSSLQSENLLYVNIHYKLFRSMDLQVTKRVCI